MKFLVALCLLTASAVSSGKTLPSPASCAQFNAAVTQGTAAAQLKRFLDLQWKYLMTEYPEWATYVGYPGQNDRWTDSSLAAIERRRSEEKCQLVALKKIKRLALPANQRINQDLAIHDLELNIEGDGFDGDYMPMNQLSGIQVDTIDVIAAMPAGSKKDFENILARLEKMPTLTEQNIGLLREGVRRGSTTTKLFMPKVSEQIDSLLTAKVVESPLYKPFTEMGADISKEDQAALRTKAQATIQDQVYPALRKLKEFINTEYIPKARTSFAWTDLPNGKAWYAYMVRKHTTTTMTPEELHELGLKEVDRIVSAMTAVKNQVGFKGDLKAFNKFLLTDKQFYFKTPEELLTAFRDIAKRIDPELTKMFRNLPRLTYGVREIPPFRATSAPGAEYQNGSLEAGRPGWFQANTFDLPSRPKWEMETLTFHEAVPGHHLQGSVAQELEGLPEFRKYAGNTAYIEGWALYAESLGEEMGFYKDPYQLYGHYSDEILRAVRLVVDTGLHAKGWSKQQALDYYRSKMPTTDVDSENEINRYMVWPGQALAYKVGQLKIRELRNKATSQLGEKFDVRSFHDLILGQGALPMDVLEKQVDEWIVSQKKSSLSKSKKL